MEQFQGKIIYDWKSAKNLRDWKVDGVAELCITNGGELLIRTKDELIDKDTRVACSNVWLKDLELPKSYEIEWTYRCEKPGAVMIIFNALPFKLHDIFDDPRSAATYPDISAGRKMVAYTIGFNRPGRPSVLRKIGGDVPTSWDDPAPQSAAWWDVNRTTSQSETTEPFTPDIDKNTRIDYKLRNQCGHIRFWVNNILIHDYMDQGQYPHYRSILTGGKMGFRNFHGVSEDYYSEIIVRDIT